MRWPGTVATRVRASICVVLFAVASQSSGEMSDHDEQTRRDPAVEFAEIVRLLALQSGHIVADVGAGGGTWTFRLARYVGATGQVFATEVRPKLVASLAKSVQILGLRNVTTVLGTEYSTGLPEGCCHAALLRLVYHAFDRPTDMRTSLSRSLVIGGRLLVVDFQPSVDTLKADMIATGFTHEVTIPAWQGQTGVYAVLFTKQR